MQARLTFNNNRTYGWNVPVTLRSRQKLNVTLQFKDGTSVTYKDVIEYEHMFQEQHDVNNTVNACVEFKDGNYKTYPLNSIQSIHLSETSL